MIGKIINVISVFIVVFCFSSKHHNKQHIIDSEGNIVATVVKKALDKKGVLRMESNKENVDFFFITPCDSVKRQILSRFSDENPEHVLNETIWHFIYFKGSRVDYSGIVFFNEMVREKHITKVDDFLSDIGREYSEMIINDNKELLSKQDFVIMFRIHYW